MILFFSRVGSGSCQSASRSTTPLVMIKQKGPDDDKIRHAPSCSQLTAGGNLRLYFYESFTDWLTDTKTKMTTSLWIYLSFNDWQADSLMTTRFVMHPHEANFQQTETSDFFRQCILHWLADWLKDLMAKSRNRRKQAFIEWSFSMNLLVL